MAFWQEACSLLPSDSPVRDNCMPLAVSARTDLVSASNQSLAFDILIVMFLLAPLVSLALGLEIILLSLILFRVPLTVVSKMLFNLWVDVLSSCLSPILGGDWSGMLLRANLRNLSLLEVRSSSLIQRNRNSAYPPSPDAPLIRARGRASPLSPPHAWTLASLPPCTSSSGQLVGSQSSPLSDARLEDNAVRRLGRSRARWTDRARQKGVGWPVDPECHRT